MTSKASTPEDGNLRRRRVKIWVAGTIITFAGLAGTWFALSLWQLSHARSLLTERRHEQALAWLNRAESFRPGIAETSFLQARTYRRLGKMQLMRSSLENAWKRGYPVEKLEREQRLAPAQLGRLQEALPHLPAMLADPQDDASDICEAYISGYLLTYQFKPANGLLEAWIKDCPDDPQAFFVQGRIYDELSNYKDAAESFEESLRLAPDRTDIRARYARTLTDLHRYDDAGEQYELLIAELDNDPDTLSGWAKCLVETARGEEARDVYRKVFELDPSHQEAQIGLARLEFQQGNHKDSLAILQPLFEKNPRKSSIRYLLGQVLRSLGRKDEAKAHLEYSQEAESAIRRVGVLMDEVRDHPGDPKRRFEIGTILLKYGHRSDGAGWLRSAVEVDSRFQPAHEALLTYYTEEGLSELAARHRAVLSGPTSTDETESPSPAPSSRKSK
mgnify:CR=1 FL=1